jgi:hypothetical protein
MVAGRHLIKYFNVYGVTITPVQRMKIVQQLQRVSSHLFHDAILIYTIQNVPGGKVNILGGHSIGHSKQILYSFMCSIPNGF